MFAPHQTMLLNADFTARASLAPDRHRWIASPQPGVERVMLDRLGAERARATSLVRYAPGSRFPAHAHPGGEEILVLDGTFSDESGDYPAGWYLRHPPGSAHQPASREGALIFVKLWQMPPTQTATVRIDTRRADAWTVEGERAWCPLFTDADERVALHRLGAGEALFGPAFERPPRHAELLVLDGLLRVDGTPLARGGWLRLPPDDRPALRAGDAGALVYLKLGTPHVVAPGA